MYTMCILPTFRAEYAAFPRVSSIKLAPFGLNPAETIRKAFSVALLPWAAIISHLLQETCYLLIFHYDHILPDVV